MKNIEIYEPAMCCSTGLCGTGIDPELLRVSTLVSSFSKKGITIKRYNLTSNPQEFISNMIVNEKISKDGVDILPITLLDGVLTKIKVYPSNKEIEKWLELTIDSDNSSNEACCSTKNSSDITCKPTITETGSCCG